MDESQIAQIFQDELNQQVISVIDKSKGVDQEVKIIQTKSNKFVIKIPYKEKDKVLKEIVATKLCSEKGIPVPKIIYSTNEFLIETCIDGVDLDDLKTSKKNYEQIYFQIGKLTKIIHSIKGKNFGSVNQNKLIGNYNSQKKAHLKRILAEIKRLENLNYYSKEKIKKIKKYFKTNETILNTKQSVLLHSDITDSNIIVKNNKVTGIIDFGDLSVGPAMQDFTFMYIDHFGDYKFKKLLEGYAENNFKEIEFYAFCTICWLISSKIEREEFDKKFKHMKKIFENIWN